jgi:hypothetical protein
LTKKGYIKDLKDKISTKQLKIIQKSISSKQLSYQRPSTHRNTAVLSKKDPASTEETALSAFSSTLMPGKHHPGEPFPYFTLDRVENLTNLYVVGNCKFSEEYKCAKKKGTDGVELILDHIIDSNGVGEPDESQEIIMEDYNPKNL